MAVFAPIPKANDSVATVKNPGLRASSRPPWRMSCQQFSSQPDSFISYNNVSSAKKLAGPNRIPFPPPNLLF